MPRARSRRSSRADVVAVCRRRRAALGRLADRVRPAARASFSCTARATSCCCAPSWMFALELVARSSSCAPTIRRRDVAELLDQPDVAQDQARPGTRGRASAAAFAGSIGSFARHRDRERAEDLAVVPDLDRRSAGELRELAVRPSAAESARRPRRPRGRRPDPPPTRSHTVASVAPGAPPRGLRHPRQDVVGRVRLGHALGELGEHLVRGRPAAVDDPVGDAPRDAAAPARTRAPTAAAATTAAVRLAPDETRRPSSTTTRRTRGATGRAST